MSIVIVCGDSLLGIWYFFSSSSSVSIYVCSTLHIFCVLFILLIRFSLRQDILSSIKLFIVIAMPHGCLLDMFYTLFFLFYSLLLPLFYVIIPHEIKFKSTQLDYSSKRRWFSIHAEKKKKINFQWNFIFTLRHNQNELFPFF